MVRADPKVGGWAEAPDPTFWTALFRYRLSQFSAEKLENFLLALLYFEQDRLRHSSVVLPRVNLTRLQEDSPQISDALLRVESRQLHFHARQIGSFCTLAPVAGERETGWIVGRRSATSDGFPIARRARIRVVSVRLRPERQ